MAAERTDDAGERARAALAHAAATAGCTALRAGDFAAARAHYERAVALAPADRAALAGLGASAQHAGDLAAAHAAFTRCVNAHPDHAEDWCNLGGACAALGRLHDAATAYRRALAVAVDFAPAWRGLVWVLLHAGNAAPRHADRTADRTADPAAELDAAVAAWAAACPDDPTARHLSRARGGAGARAVPARCEPAFVAEHFDQFAPDYDRVLARLEPVIATTFEAMWRDAGVTAAVVLDLGCGTGVASAWLRRPGRRLVGVDLSVRMLERAAERGLHDELHEADALAFLRATEARFDAIVLADVVPYFGDLAPLLAAVARVLTAGGHVLLSHEDTAEPGWRLAASGRFQHHPDAVRDAAAAAGLECRSSRAGPLRREAGEPVAGHCVLLRRSDP